MATIPLGPIEPYNTPPGYAVRRFPITAGQVFLKGAIVVLDAAGTLVEGGADPANIWGIADAPAAQAASEPDGKIPIILPLESMMFIGNLGGASVTAQTDLGKAYGVVKGATYWHVDKTDVVNTRVVVEDFDRRDVIGDINGRVVFKFRGASIAHLAGL